MKLTWLQSKSKLALSLAQLSPSLYSNIDKQPGAELGQVQAGIGLYCRFSFSRFSFAELIGWN